MKTKLSQQFHAALTTAAKDLTASQIAAAISPVLSIRTVEEWLQDRRTPPDWTQSFILQMVTKTAARRRLASAPEITRIIELHNLRMKAQAEGYE